MAITLTMRDAGSYLHVWLSGSWSVVEFHQAVDGIYAAALRRGHTKVLVDRRGVMGELPIMDRYHVGVYLAAVWGPRLQGAILCAPELITHFMENTAVNRGAFIQVFAEEAAALAWLQGS